MDQIFSKGHTEVHWQNTTSRKRAFTQQHSIVLLLPLQNEQFKTPFVLYLTYQSRLSLQAQKKVSPRLSRPKRPKLYSTKEEYYYISSLEYHPIKRKEDFPIASLICKHLFCHLCCLPNDCQIQQKNRGIFALVLGKLLSTQIFHILLAMLEWFFCQKFRERKQSRATEIGFCMQNENRGGSEEELQHSLKANKSLELLCSSRPKKGRVVVGSLKILCCCFSVSVRPSFYNVGREENFCAFKLSLLDAK